MKRYKVVTASNVVSSSSESGRRSRIQQIRNGCRDLMHLVDKLREDMNDAEYDELGLYELHDDLTEYIMQFNSLLDAGE